MGCRQSKRETDSEQLGPRKRMIARERVREPWGVRRRGSGQEERRGDGPRGLEEAYGSHM